MIRRRAGSNRQRAVDRRVAGTPEFARARPAVIRSRLLEIGARIEVGKTLLRFHFPADHPMLQPLLACGSAILAALNTV
jgi:hypothetical protein